MSNSAWTVILVILFFIGMWAFPNHPGTIAGFPADYLITLGVGVLFLVVMGYFGWQQIHSDPEGGSES